MSYSTIAKSAADQDLMKRVAACAAQEGTDAEPTVWATEHIWQIVSNPEIEAAYAYALGTGNQVPGADEGVITDAMILAQVQPMVLAETEV